MPNTEAQTRAIMKWRANNHEHYNETQIAYTKKYYLANREKRLEYARMYREKKRAERESSGDEINPDI